MKILGMVYSEEVLMLHRKFIKKNEKAVNFWLIFAATDQTKQMKVDKKWFQRIKI